MSDRIHRSLIDRLLAEYERTGAMPIVSGGDHDDENGDQKPITPPAIDPESLGDAGKAALKAERDARKVAEKAAKDAQDELTSLKAAATKAADEEAAEQGKWKELAEKRESDLTSATTDLASTKERLTTLESLATERLTALLADIPAEIAALGPDDDTPIEKRLAWAEKAAKAAAATTGIKPGNGPNPNPADGKTEIPSAVPRARMW